MSLTNPNSVITEERLNEFYQGILPYLGGMPELVANKIDRSNMYSTTEKLVGQYTDGKPIYQKSWVTTTPNCTTSGTQVTTTLTVGASVDKYIKIEGQILGASSYTSKHIPWYVYSGGQTLQLYAAGYTNTYTTTASRNTIIIGLNYKDYANQPCIITAQYTKTTDSAQSIGIDTDYSTTEKIIGTWINGKPIYQKTVSLGALPNATSKNVAHGISNLGIVINIIATAYNSSGQQIPLNFSPVDNVVNACNIRIMGANININSGIDRSGFTGYCTLQYTKTTD